MIDRETQQRIKDAANIVEVVGDYVKLTRRGANYMGLCPFHNERTPSFSVSPRKNFCHCFSCKKGGSPVNFLMEKEGIGYTEALLLLAKKYNIPVQERELSDEERARMSEREAMLVANEWAMKQFHDNLYNTEEGRNIGLAYLYSRGITDAAIKRFKLGYSIDRGDALLSKAKTEGFDIEVFEKLGLVGHSQQGRLYDKFRGRVMFPIRNASGKPVAFGGRTLKGESAKYINSPETLLYKKSNELYGIFEAKADAIKLDRIFLMEGYLDVIGSWQAGITNAVASSGTALTESQIALIHRFTDNVTLIYDGDSAGIKASMRGIDMLLSQKLHVKVLLLPDGEDPDSFARNRTSEEFKNYIDSHETDFIRFKIEALLRNAGNDPQAISEATKSVVGSIACIPDEIERISYVKECANLMGIDEKVIARQVAQNLIDNLSRQSRQHNFNENRHIASSVDNEAQTSQSPTPAHSVAENKSSPYHKHEREILKYCIRYGFLPIEIDDEQTQTVVAFIAEEMEADGIEFSAEVFKNIFYILKERENLFVEKFEEYKLHLEEILKKDRSAFHENLRMEGGSMARLKKEEKIYFAEENKKREELLKQFAIGFSVDFLINHEDSQVREIANSLVAERHVLSSIYKRQGSETMLEEDKLSELVPRALSELRSEILNNKVLELQKKVAMAIDNNDREQQQKLMAMLTKILYVRARLAENLGERIISPR